MDKFLAVSKCTMADGATALFWTDSWLDNSSDVLAIKFARLFSFAHDKLISIKEVCDTRELITLFQLPLSERAFTELHSLQSLMVQYHDRDLVQDTWTWRFGKKGVYTAKKFYTHVHEPLHSNPLLMWIWKSCCTLKTKVFAWLVIMDRLNTKDMLLRRH